MLSVTKKEIEERYKIYNIEYFEGVLPPCKCSIFYGNQIFGRYTKNHIWISVNVDWAEDTIKEVILHEMVHHYVYSIEHKNGGLFGHNWRFRRMCRKIKKRYNIKIHVKAFHIKRKKARK